MNKKHHSLFLAVATSFVIIGFVQLFSVVHAECSSERNSFRKQSAETLSIHSYPLGLKVYITPLNSLLGKLDETKWISEEYFVGETPVEVPLDEGDYRVAVQNNKSFNVYNDGESKKLQVWTGKTFLDETKCYHYFKPSGHKNILVAIFWPKTMSIHDFLKTLPKKDFVVIGDGHRSSFKKEFMKHQVLQKDWESLISMFRKTGKLVWHGKNESEYLYITVTEVGDDGQLIKISIQPVLEFK